MACRALLESAPSLGARTEMLGGTTTALHFMAFRGHETATRALLELAPSPEVQKAMLLARSNSRSNSGATALLLAAQQGHEA
eukprot:1195587-Prorocentrum_lima.AAC.1